MTAEFGSAARTLPARRAAHRDGLVLRNDQRGHVVAAAERAGQIAAPDPRVGSDSGRAGRRAGRGACTGTGTGCCASSGASTATAASTPAASGLGKGKRASCRDQRGGQEWSCFHRRLSCGSLLTLLRRSQENRPASAWFLVR